MRWTIEYIDGVPCGIVLLEGRQESDAVAQIIFRCIANQRILEERLEKEEIEIPEGIIQRDEGIKTGLTGGGK